MINSVIHCSSIVNACISAQMLCSILDSYIKNNPAGKIKRIRALDGCQIKATKLHFKSPKAERRHVLCVGVGGDQTHVLVNQNICHSE